MGWPNGQKGQRGAMGRQPMLGVAQNPSFSVKEMKELKEFQAMKQQAKEAAKGNNAGKGVDNSQATQWTKWSCWNCNDLNVARHRWCEKCHADKQDSPHLSQNSQHKGKGKGKGKGKKGDSGLKDAGPTNTPAAETTVEPTVEQSVESQVAQATAKNLQFSGLSPAPPVEKLKPYPKPAQKADEAGMGSAAEDKVQKLETALAAAKSSGFADTVLKLMQKEITTAKAEQAKATKGTKEISFEALTKRISNAESSAAAALERHQAHVTALDGQITQLQKIREHRVLDFEASQQAFAARLLEDNLLLAQKKAAAPVAPQTASQTTAVNAGVATALTDLQRHYAVVASELTACPNETDQTKVDAMGSLWHFYSAVGSSPWAPLVVPAVTFDTLQVSPSFVHTLLGDAVWEGYWRETHNVVQGSQYIPTTMHNVLQHILEEKHQELSLMAMAKETALVRFETAKAAQAQRKLDGDPF